METSFGNWIKRRRKALDLTQEGLAQRVGISMSAIFKIEADERRPSKQVAELLATHLEIPPDQRPLFMKIARREKAVDSLGELTATGIAAQRSSSSHLPLSSKLLVGREFELAEIARLIGDPQSRLFTLIGQGGVGKTHLATHVALSRQENNPTATTVFVNLSPETGREQMVTAIATALGIVLYSASDRADQLISYLQSRELLLILDNFEHLASEPGCVELVSDILGKAGRVKILVTSRQPLQLQPEWVFEVQGLPIPDRDQPGELEQNSAETLFLQRAQQAAVGFQPTEEDRAAIAQICELVEGLPLGIELAAAWVRTLSCQEIAEEIQRSIHFLASSNRDLPERHRSIHATIEYSWKLLADEEQKALQSLSIFQGGFNRQAAEQAAGATLPVLSALVAKSFVRRVGAGRYDMHGLIQQYAGERLQETDADREEIWGKFACYYANLLDQRGQALKGMERTAVVEELILELPNLRQAWQWAARHHWTREVSASADTLFWLYESRSNCREGIPLFNEVVQSLRAGKQDEPDESALALGLALSYKGYFLYRQGQHRQGREVLNSSLQTLETIAGRDWREADMAISNATIFLGTVTSVMGDFTEGDRLLQEGLEMKQRLKDVWGAAFCLRQIGFCAFHYQGDFDRAYQALHQSLIISREIGNAWSIAASLSQLGVVAFAQGDYHQAQQYLSEALELSRMLQDRASIATALGNLGRVKTAQGQYEEGYHLLLESSTLWTEIGDRGSQADALTHTGSVLLHMGELVEAREQFRKALSIASEIQTLPVLLEALTGEAQVEIANGHLERALWIITAVILNESASSAVRTRAEQLRSELENQLPDQRIQDIREQAGQTSILSVVQEIFTPYTETT